MLQKIKDIGQIIEKRIITNPLKLRDRKLKKVREMYILEGFDKKYPQFVYYEIREKPDFELYDEFKKYICDCEVTELIGEEVVKWRKQIMKKRGSSILSAHSQPGVPSEQEGIRNRTNLLELLRKLIRKKSNKRYENKTILLIYLNDDTTSIIHNSDFFKRFDDYEVILKNTIKEFNFSESNITNVFAVSNPLNGKKEILQLK